LKKRKVKRGKARSEERKDRHKWWRKGIREEERESFYKDHLSLSLCSRHYYHQYYHRK